MTLSQQTPLALKKMVVCILAFFSIHSNVLANWDYKYLEKDHADMQIQEKGFQHLKKSVIHYVKDSWCSAEKASLLMDLVCLERPTTCVEIGVFTGSSLLPVAATLAYLNHGKIYAIDPWSNQEATKYYPPGEANSVWWSQVNMKSIQNSFLKMQKTWKVQPYCKTIVAASKDAAAQIDHIDLLHIDGNYTEEGTLEDITLYLPKVVSGGYILYSGFSTTINGNVTRIKPFQLLLNECVIVAIIDDRNCFLLKKL